MLGAHAVRLIKAGVKPLISGTMGEAHHLSHEERVAVIKAVRTALDEAGFAETPTVAGTGAGSTRETILLSKAAAEAGADYAIVICSGYFAGALAGNKKALKAFWSEVSDKSPIPVIIYNCECGDCVSYFRGDAEYANRPRSCWWDRLGLGPDYGVSGGVPELGGRETHVRHTHTLKQRAGLRKEYLCRCGNVGKLTRICATVSESSFASAHPRRNEHAPFLVLGGFTDFILTSSMVNGHGAITGLANVAPVSPQHPLPCLPTR